MSPILRYTQSLLETTDKTFLDFENHVQAIERQIVKRFCCHFISLTYGNASSDYASVSKCKNQAFPFPRPNRL